MNAKLATKSLVVASFAALFASASFADSLSNEAPEFHAPSTKSRAEVVQELQAARANGELRVTSEGYGYVPKATAVSTKSRAEVRAEVVKALQAGERFSQGDRG